MSVLSRVTREVSHSFTDAYGSLVLGDDAGKSARLVYVCHPNFKNSKLQLGMTFCEVNGRAYVKSVDSNSSAARAGIMPRDAVQFAAVSKNDWIPSEDDIRENENDADNSAAQHALECESRGMRISYTELKRVLAEGTNVQDVFTSPSPQRNCSKNKSWKGPPIPSTINVCAPSHEEEEDFNNNNAGRPSSPFRGASPRPVVFVFRRTRQRQSLHPIGILPAFRLDDECDFASSLIQRLAPTTDMELPPPDSWQELVQDGTDWLLGNGSMLPPKNGILVENNTTRPSHTQQDDDETGIPLDDYEMERRQKLAKLRSRMAAEAIRVDRTEDVEAATIRGMIQKAVGLAFVRASKVVVGVSLHIGSGICIARLSDGTWSAPSSIGTWGCGLGIQFGLEVAEYIFILQTQESLNHFCRGGSFTIGGNVGAAVAGMGREAYGAASIGPMCGRDVTLHTQQDDEYNDDDSDENQNLSSGIGIAPIVAYAKSQGLYVGVSLEGSRIFTRNDINTRAYKFTTGREVSANDILSGKVATPPEAEDLYASLHSVEFTHEMSCLPRPPEVLRNDSSNAWYYDRATLGEHNNHNNNMSSSDPFNFLTAMSKEESEECEAFETDFKKFMYGGVSVQRLLPNLESRSGKTRKERRTLWLMLPEMGSLRLGFVSKLSDGDGAVSNKSSTQRASKQQLSSDAYSVSALEGDQGTVASEEVTLDSAFMEKDTNNMGHIRTGNVQLSNKHSVALTDVTVLSQEPHVPIRFNSDDQTEHLRVISIQDVSGTSLLFVANNFREAELLVCGLKLLLELETARLSVRGGVPITALGGRAGDGSMSPAAARGFKETPLVGASGGSYREKRMSSTSSSRSRGRRSYREVSGYSSSEIDADEDSNYATEDSFGLQPRHKVPEGRQSWGRVPGRQYMREQASPMLSPHYGEDAVHSRNASGIPKYVHGQMLVRDISKNVELPLPLPLCRVLLLDSSSPVISKWEKDRGDTNFEKTDWTFPPATPRELERHASEHQLIASGSMMGAHRTTAFDRSRNGTMVHLSETQIVDADDSEKLAFTVSERVPRRGFSIKVRVLLRSAKENSCEASVLAEVRPVGKNMSNHTAVHKAFLLVLNEIKMRYGTEGKGLMAGFLSVVNSLPNAGVTDDSVGSFSKNSMNVSPARSSGSSKSKLSSLTRPFRRTEPRAKENNVPNTSKNTSPNGTESGLVSFEDMLKPQRSHSSEPRHVLERPPTPSMMHVDSSSPPKQPRSKKSAADYKTAEFLDVPADERDATATQPVTIEVKPLPKIRLSLMPAPREEDEENYSSGSPAQPTTKKKKSRRKHKSRRSRHS